LPPSATNQDADVAVERPVEARQAARGRVAGDAGVDDFEIEVSGVEALLAAATDTTQPWQCRVPR